MRDVGPCGCVDGRRPRRVSLGRREFEWKTYMYVYAVRMSNVSSDAILRVHLFYLGLHPSPCDHSF